jgi:hypothetical protein
LIEAVRTATDVWGPDHESRHFFRPIARWHHRTSAHRCYAVCRRGRIGSNN